jgi:hypothetical protein
MNLCCRPYGKTNSHPSPPTTQWGARYFFAVFFLGSQNKPFYLFACEWTLDMFSVLSPKACSTRLRCVKLSKFIWDMNPYRTRQTSHNFFYKPQMSSNLSNNFDLMMMVSSHLLLLKKVAPFGITQLKPKVKTYNFLTIV